MPPERLELQIQSLQIKGYGFFGYPLGYVLGVGVIFDMHDILAGKIQL